MQPLLNLSLEKTSAYKWGQWKVAAQAQESVGVSQYWGNGPSSFHTDHTSPLTGESGALPLYHE